MEKLFFWKDWSKNERIFLIVFLVFFCLAAVYLVYGYYYGISNIIDWETKSRLVPVAFNNLTYNSGPLKIELPLNQYLVFQYFDGSILKINPVFWTVYLIFLAISINLVLTVISTISKFWFYGAMGAFIGFVVLFQPDHILLFDNSNRSASILIFCIFISISYIFREFKTGLSLLSRFLVFTGATVLTGIIIYFYSGVSHPFSYLVSYGIGATLLVSVIFILSISHEIIFSILYISSGSSRSGSSRSLVHFTVMSLIFLFYVFITYLHNSERISWNLVYLNPVLVLSISAFAGFWWLRKRENLYREILPFRPNAALLYLAFGAMTFATYGFILSVGNDPVAETFEDAVIYGQIGFGIMFFMYLIANFAGMMAKGWNVIPVAYKSRTIPFFVFRLGGLLAAGFLLYQSGFLPYLQAKAGYYNLIGDLFWQNDETALAKEYYKKGSQYEYQNHRSNYALASIARLEKNKAEEIYYLENANLKKPTPYSYVNVSNRLLENDQYFEGLFKLSEGLSVFPGSPMINNNMGYFYSKTDVYDSAYYFFNIARHLKPNSPVIRANSYALIAQAGVSLSLDSIKQEIGNPESEAGYANMTALANQDGYLLDKNGIIYRPDSINTSLDFAMLFNTGLNKIRSPDTAFFSSLYRVTQRTGNPDYADNLDLIDALGLFENHQVEKAIHLMERLAIGTYRDKKYKYIPGIIYLISGDPVSALEKFGDLQSVMDPMIRFYYGVALLSSGKADSASSVFKSVMDNPDPDLKRIAREFYAALQAKTLSDTLSDEMIYTLYHYDIKGSGPYTASDFINKIKDTRVRDLVRTEEMLRRIGKNDYKEAFALMDSIQEKSVQSHRLQEMYNRINLLTLVHNMQTNGITDRVDYSTCPTNDPDFLYYMLKNATLAVQRKDSADAVKYMQFLSWDPYFEKGILTDADYYNNFIGDSYKAYQVLFDALRINRNSIVLNKAFVMQCADMNMLEYGQDNLDVLRSLMDKDQYAGFINELDEKVSASREKLRELGY